MLQGWYAALPTQEEVVNRSKEIVNTTAERLRQAQVALTNVVTAVPEVVSGGVTQANRQLTRQYPELRQGVNDFAGYQEELLEPHDCNYLRSLVLDCEIDVHYNRSGYNAFSCVASDTANVTDQKKRIEFLFSCRADVNSPSQLHHNRTPLHLLIINKNEEIALFLIHCARNSGHPIDFKRQDIYGNTPLLLAIKKGQIAVVDAILNEMKNFDSNIGLNLCDTHGKSALDHSFAMKIEKIIITLIALGAEHHTVGNHHEIVAYQEDLLKPRNIMHIRHLVLEGKVNVHHDHFGFNALSGVASASMNLEDQKEGFKFLLQCRVNINSSSQLNHNRTPIHFLIINKNEGAVLFLMEHARERKCSIDFKRQDVHGNTVLLLAIKMMQPEVAFAILDQMKKFNADVGLDLWDVDGRTALDCAVILGQISITRALIALEAKPHAVANRFSNFAKFDEKVIRSMLESVDIDPDQVCEDKHGHKILLYKKCLKDKSNVPVIFWPRLYQGLLLSPLPDWPPIFLPPLFPDQNQDPIQGEKFKIKF